MDLLVLKLLPNILELGFLETALVGLVGGADRD